MNKKSREQEAKKRELLYSYWQDLPMIMKVEHSYEEVLSHEVRGLILQYIRKGKEEKTDSIKQFRHAFSAKELLDMANEKMAEKMKLQSMYFHLQKLQEYNLLYTVTTLQEGRHHVAYFGRTARGFLFESAKDKNKYDHYFTEAEKIARAINPEMTKSKFDGLLKEFKAISQKSEKEIIQWLEDHKEIINENNIDSATLFSFLKLVSSHNKKMAKLMHEVAQLLNFKL
ncbi:MAG: hypothetical protein GF308_19555 [Candidatus Heimdallarchaeota archaeon]|nr:hypothetical protein [Candidatus Heimdallarchaeota archaeon]